MSCTAVRPRPPYSGGPVIQPNFQALTSGQQAALLASQMNNLQANYANLLAAVRAKAPNALILALGYPDPLAGLGAANPFPGSTVLTQQANAIIQGVAAAFGAKYVDIYTPFVGNEFAFTSVGTLDGGFPNIHPTPLGYQVIAKLHATVDAPLPVMIALTGYGQPEDRARALAAGFDHHLTKPVDIEEMLRLIAAHAGAAP